MRENGFSVTAEPQEVREDSEAVLAERRRAVRAVASAAMNADDCALLLDALGLKPAEGVAGVPVPRPAR
jgi:inosine/xanthosine triphosphate pyrophosphatase family protein